MVSALRIAVGPLLSLVLASPAAAVSRTPVDPEDEECGRLASRDERVTGMPDFDGVRNVAVRLTGIESLAEPEVWALVGGRPPGPVSRREAAALVARLALSGLFSAVTPRLVVGADGTPELEIELKENPRLTSVHVRGLSEFRSEDIVEQLIEVPTEREVKRRQEDLQQARARECPAPLPPRSWLARTKDGGVRPGILWQGLHAALTRVTRYLRTRGYPLARIEGELTPAGDLAIEIDEGRIGDVEVRGVDPAIRRAVVEELGFRRGDVFSSADVYSALERIERRWPFLRPDRTGRRLPPAPALRLDERADGSVTFRSEWPNGARGPDRDDDEDRTERRFWEDEGDSPPWRHRRGGSSKPSTRRAFYTFEGNTLVVYLRGERSRGKGQPVELFRHTPVTGFAPGFAMTLTVYDPADRTHLLLDGAIRVNTRRPNLAPASDDYLQRLNAHQRVDWLLGPRIRIPALAIAELGGQMHVLTDTEDTWRIAPFDSYFYSAVINRADREYFRRSGFAGFVTAHLFESVTLGAEIRRDRYDALDVPGGVWSIFNRGDVLYGAAPVDPGVMGSAVFRFEYRSEDEPLHRVGSMWRDAQTSLVEGGAPAIGLRTLNTLEVADPALGGVFHFVKVVSDTTLSMETGRKDTLTLRVRGAGGSNLPLQKQEALGGWTALRGYDFKEFRGDGSLLGTLQFEWTHFGAFVDVGSVRLDGRNWMDPKASAGVLFSFANRGARAEAAWRLDGRGRALPELRVFFTVPL